MVSLSFPPKSWIRSRSYMYRHMQNPGSTLVCEPAFQSKWYLELQPIEELWNSSLWALQLQPLATLVWQGFFSSWWVSSTGPTGCWPEPHLMMTDFLVTPLSYHMSFGKFAKACNGSLSMSTPYHNQSNRNAEAAVKKLLESRCLSSHTRVAEYSYITVDLGSSPCQHLFRRRPRSVVLNDIY